MADHRTLIFTMTAHKFPDTEIAGVYRAINERRDMRHFLPHPIDPAQLARFIDAAHKAPSVGYMQPWRFVRIVNRDLRQAIHRLVSEERMLTAQALRQRQDEFMQLKVEGILACAEVLVVALADGRDAHVFGRRTMPDMDLASVSCAIQNFWLAARAEGIGVGWVSMFDPEQLRALCKMPDGSRPVAILCVGHVEEFYRAPMLELECWDQRLPLEKIVFEDYWDNRADDNAPT